MGEEWTLCLVQTVALNFIKLSQLATILGTLHMVRAIRQASLCQTSGCYETWTKIHGKEHE